MPYLGEKHVGDRARREAAQSGLSGPGFPQSTVDATETLEVWYSSFSDDGGDYTEWRALDAKGDVLATKRVGGY